MYKKLLSLICTALSFISYSQNTCNIVPADVSFGECAMFLGIGYHETLGCIEYSGCSYVGSDGIDYLELLYPSIEECEFRCDTCELMPLGVDFGLCDMFLGFANVDGEGCIGLSGCSYIDANGVDYTSYFYNSSYECSQACVSDTVISLCIDESLINLNAICPMIWAPVCGCDGITYSNTCVATNYGGVLTWVDGECITSVEEFDPSLLNLYPNPAENTLFIQNGSNQKISRIEVYDQQGRMISSNNITAPKLITINVADLPSGLYHLRVSLENINAIVTKTFVK